MAGSKRHLDSKMIQLTLLSLGLDPSEPYFQGTSAAVRLDITDATFVDVIHTDGLPFNPKLGTHYQLWAELKCCNLINEPNFIINLVFCNNSCFSRGKGSIIFTECLFNANSQVWGCHSLWDTLTSTPMEDS